MELTGAKRKAGERSGAENPRKKSGAAAKVQLNEATQRLDLSARNDPERIHTDTKRVLEDEADEVKEGGPAVTGQASDLGTRGDPENIHTDTKRRLEDEADELKEAASEDSSEPGDYYMYLWYSDDSTEVIDTIRQQGVITELDLSRRGFFPKGLARICESTKYLKKLIIKDIVLYDQRYYEKRRCGEDDNVESVFSSQVLGQCPNLEYIDITGCSETTKKLILGSGEHCKQDQLKQMGIEVVDIIDKNNTLKTLLMPGKLTSPGLKGQVRDQIQSLVREQGIPANCSLDGWSLLHTACAFGDVELAQWLISRGGRCEFEWKSKVGLVASSHHELYRDYYDYEDESDGNEKPTAKDCRIWSTYPSEFQVALSLHHSNDIHHLASILEAHFALSPQLTAANVMDWCFFQDDVCTGSNVQDGSAWMKAMHNPQCNPMKHLRHAISVVSGDQVSRETLLDELFRRIDNEVCCEEEALAGAVKFLIGSDFKEEDDPKDTCPSDPCVVMPYLLRAGSRLSVFQSLLDSISDINSVDDEGNTALFKVLYDIKDAALTIKKCQMLLNQGAKINVQNNDGETPLLYCISTTLKPCYVQTTVPELQREEDTLQYSLSLTHVCHFLIKSGADMQLVPVENGGTLCHWLLYALKAACPTWCWSGPMDIFCELLTLIRDLGHTQIMQHRNFSGETPLHVWAALYTGHYYFLSTPEDILTPVAESLLRNGCPINGRNDKGETPLHVARDDFTAHLLLEMGANANAEDDDGNTPFLTRAKLGIGVSSRDKEHGAWKNVMKQGYNVWIGNASGETVLGALLQKNQLHLARTLLQVLKERDCANVNKAFTTGDSALHITCSCTKDVQDIIDDLLKSRANTNATNKKGQTPLHVACEKVLEAKDDFVNSVQFWAVGQLLKCGADANIKDADGNSCLDIAREMPELQDLLRKPIDLLEIPLLLPWCSENEKHKGKLAQVSRGQKCQQIQQIHYHTESIASGSFGHVFVGINERDGREVAIKRLVKEQMSRPEDRREIDNLVVLKDCEQVVKYLLCCEDDHFVYLILELMEGTLQDFLDDRKPKEKELVAGCKDIVQGIQFLHENKIIHRDLKPSNILYKVTPKLRLKIADFGLSTKASFSAANLTTVLHTNAGTRCWMAPELLQAPSCSSQPEHSVASDVFACGLVLHFTLANMKHPFAPEDAEGRGAIEVQNKTEGNIMSHTMNLDDELCAEGCCLLELMLVRDKTKRPTMKDTLKQPFFWEDKKKRDFLCAVANQPEFVKSKRPSPVCQDLDNSLGSRFKVSPWNLQSPEIQRIYSEVTMSHIKRKYDTSSAVELVRFVRNCYAHVSDRSRSTPMKKLLLEDFVFFDKFPSLLMDVHKAVITHGLDQREEIKSALAVE